MKESHSCLVIYVFDVVVGLYAMVFMQNIYIYLKFNHLSNYFHQIIQIGKILI